jgi:crossover junction endodeoxyribonuclease RusA
MTLSRASTPLPLISVTLPWPSKDLSPNARLHWARKAKAVKQARAGAHYLIIEARGHARRAGEAARLSMTFCPPDKRRRDRDNIIASMKAATDGIADALRIDDSKFEVSYRMGDPVKGGAVQVTIEERP